MSLLYIRPMREYAAAYAFITNSLITINLNESPDIDQAGRKI